MQCIIAGRALLSRVDRAPGAAPPQMSATIHPMKPGGAEPGARCLKIDPTHAETKHNLALLLRRLGRQSAA
jgi:hypothetical protein